LDYSIVQEGIQKIAFDSSSGNQVTETDRIINVEKVTGEGTNSTVFLTGAAADAAASYDLANQKVTLTQSTGTKTYGITNFNKLAGTSNADKFLGSAANEEFYAYEGNDLLLPSAGNDFFAAGAGSDTADYSSLADPITARVKNGPGGPGDDFAIGFSVDKGNGTDSLTDEVEVVVAPSGKANTLVCQFFQPDGYDVDLSKNQVSGRTTRFEPYTVKNFVNVIGSEFNDTIIGDAANNQLRGANGNDTLTGGDGNDFLGGGANNDKLNGGNGSDRLTGTSVQAKGVGELDSLTGDGGNDTFILGDSAGSYYKGNGSNDYATITDFSLGDRLTFGANDSYSVQISGNKVNFFATSNGKSDQIASVQLSGSVQSIFGSSLTALQGQSVQASALSSSAFSVTDSSLPIA
jgi:Ca2+-binding RTX toxin-like protein